MAHPSIVRLILLPYFHLYANSGKMIYCKATILEGFTTHENKCNQKRTGWDTARPRRQHPNLIGQPISGRLPADAGRRAHRDYVGDTFGQHAPEPIRIGERHEILRKTAARIRHRPERTDPGFPSFEVIRTERLRLHYAADVSDDFRHLQARQMLRFRQTLRAPDGRRQRSLRFLRHRDRLADRQSRQQGKRHFDHHRQPDRNRADDPAAGSGRHSVRQRHTSDLLPDRRHRPIRRPSRRRRQARK